MIFEFMLNKRQILQAILASLLSMTAILLVNSKEENFWKTVLGMLLFFCSMWIIILASTRK
jgi:hypothetical protein